MPSPVPSSFSSIATDSTRNFKFLVEISHFANNRAGGQSLITLGFMSVDGLGMTTEAIPYREGGFNTTPQYMPGQTQFSSLTLQKGMTLSGASLLEDWNKQVFAVAAGTGYTSGFEDFRAASVDIKVLDHPVTRNNDQTPIRSWFRCYRAWPSALNYSSLDAGGNGLLVQTMTLVHEGFSAVHATALNQEASSPPAY